MLTLNEADYKYATELVPMSWQPWKNASNFMFILHAIRLGPVFFSLVVDIFISQLVLYLMQSANTMFYLVCVYYMHIQKHTFLPVSFATLGLRKLSWEKSLLVPLCTACSWPAGWLPLVLCVSIAVSECVVWDIPGKCIEGITACDLK